MFELLEEENTLEPKLCWPPLRGQSAPHCSLRKRGTPHVVRGTFHGLFPAMNTLTENTPDEYELQPKRSLCLNLIISGLLFLVVKEHRAVLGSFTICFFLKYFSYLWQHTKHANITMALTYSNTTFQVKVVPSPPVRWDTLTLGHTYTIVTDFLQFIPQPSQAFSEGSIMTTGSIAPP